MNNQVINLLANGSFEETGSWNSVSENGAKITFCDTKQHHTGKSACKITLNGTGNEGSAACEQTVTVKEKGTYTASVYVMTKDVKQAKAKWQIFVKQKEGDPETEGDEDDWADPDETVSGSDTEDPETPIDPDEDADGGEDGTVSENTEAALQNGYRRLTRTLKVSKGAELTMRFSFAGEKGSAWFDCAKLQKGSVAGQYNMLPNAGLEEETDGIPTGFTYEGGSEEAQKPYLTKDAHTQGEQSFCIVGETDQKKKLIVKPDFGSDQSSYVLSAFVKADCTPVNQDRKCEICICKGDAVRKKYIIPTAIDGWQFVSVPLPTGNWNGARIEFRFFNEYGKLYIDDCMLTRNEVQTKTFTKSGKTLTKTVRERTTAYGTNARDLQNKKKSAGGCTTTYTYDKNTNALKKAVTTVGADSYYSYDRYGNQTEEKEMGTTAEKPENIIKTSVSYLTDEKNAGCYQTSSTDTRGNKTSYSYDLSRGLLTKLTDPLLHSTEYNYDTQGALIQSDFSGITASNTYDTYHNLTKITQGYTDYRFTYDVFGNVLTIGEQKKGSKRKMRSLVSNSYQKQNGKLASTKYGNGATLKMIYNKYEQLAQEKWSDGKTLTYEYDNTGALAKTTDQENRLRYQYSYDFTGRVTDSQVLALDQKGSHEVVSLQNMYDAAGRVSTFSSRYGSGVRTSKFTYRKDDTLESTFLATKGEEKLTYDLLGRVTKTEFQPVYQGKDALKKAALVTNSYSYLTTTLGTTMMKDTYVTTVGDTTAVKESLSYDQAGKLTSLGESSYTYDNLDRLVNADTKEGHYSYTYDEGGNLTGCSSQDTLSGNTQEYEYRYDSKAPDHLIYFGKKDNSSLLAKLKAKLTKKKANIKYDKGGNPTTYRDQKLTWKHGRMLYKVGKDISYTYKQDGTRLSKTVGKEKTTYILNGSTILAEKRPTEELHYYYSGSGKLLQIGYTDLNQTASGNSAAAETIYNVIRNAQDDVTAIYTKKGALVGTYTYDPWGKLLSTEKASEDADPQNILTKNPFRYRGYYYDAETGWYYLQSRYYDPEVKRFLNADTTALLTGSCDTPMQYNLYAYCCDDPVNKVDPSGHFALSNKAKLAIGGLGIVAGVAITVATGGAALGVFAAMAGTVASSTASGAVLGYITGGQQGAIDGACDGFMWGGITVAVGAIAHAATQATKSVKAVEGGLNSNLLDELANSGVKYNTDDVVTVMKNSDGKLMWLENGNSKAGLTHILERHADDFASQGVSDIPNLLENVLSTSPVKTGSNAKGLFADYMLNGNSYRVAYGTNGFVVSFYPID